MTKTVIKLGDTNTFTIQNLLSFPSSTADYISTLNLRSQNQGQTMRLLTQGRGQLGIVQDLQG